MLIFYFITVILSFTFIPPICGEGKEAEKPYIDYLTLDYLLVEQSLWSEINTDTDPNKLFSLVQNEHRRFISSDFGVSTSTTDIYIPSGILVDNLKQVNNLFYNTSILLNSGSIDSINYYDIHAILRNAVKFSENVFREAIRAEFWEKGKHYIQHCRELKTSPITIESEFQLIYNYYKDVRAALLKTYILTQLSHMLININNKVAGNHIASQPYDAKTELDGRVDLIRRNVKNLLKIAKRDSWVCDRFPHLHANEGYEQVTKFLQGYIDNELNFNQEDTCAKNCEDFTKTEHVRCANETLCANNRRQDVAVCSGRVRECKELKDDNVQICYGNDDLKRYHYLKYSNGKQFGKKPTTECSSVNHAKSWRRWFVKCSSCYCLCDDANGSERHFSLHEVVSDVEQNKIVTGVRLVKENGVIQISISQRTLMPFGQTDESEQDTWKLSANQFAISDIGAVEGINYTTLTYENRAINLDDLVLPQDKVVTGVRFQLNSNGHLTLEIRATDFDYFYGRLHNVTHNPWAKNENGGQIEIEIQQKLNPLENVVNELYVPENIPNAYVKFQTSDIESDVGQSTVPFIDTFPLESRNPVALSGIGLTYKRNSEAGGFITLKTITYDFAIADIEDEYEYID